MAAIRLTRTHRILVGVVVAGAVVIAGIGFAGSYAAVRTLALHKGFGWFANVFPIGVDAGIVVLLALDLLLTWLRIPFPLLRQTAWLLTAATIAFNGAAAWPDPLGVGMHAIIPVLFVVSVEAARHAIGRVADITADKHMESVRITRWLLAPVPTFRLWRRMKLWELRSYEEVIRREQDRLVYRARLRARYGAAWRRKAPVEAIMPLRLARYGVPLAETADAGLQAAGIEVAPFVRQLEAAPAALRDEAAGPAGSAGSPGAAGAASHGRGGGEPARAAVGSAWEQAPPQAAFPAGRDRVQATGPTAFQAPGQGAGGPGTPRPQSSEQPLPVEDPDARAYAEQQAYERQMAYEQQQWEEQGRPEPWQGTPHDSPWFAAAQRYEREQYLLAQRQAEQQAGQEARQRAEQNGQPRYDAQLRPDPQAQQYAAGGRFEQAAAQDGQREQVMVPAGPEQMRPLGNGGAVNGTAGATIPGPRHEEPYEAYEEYEGYGPEPSQQTRQPSPSRPQGQGPVQAKGQGRPQAAYERQPAPEPEPGPETETYPVAGMDLPEDVTPADAYFAAYRSYVQQHGQMPNAHQLVRFLPTLFAGTPPEERHLISAIRDLRYRYTSEADAESIP